MEKTWVLIWGLFLSAGGGAKDRPGDGSQRRGEEEGVQQDQHNEG